MLRRYGCRQAGRQEVDSFRRPEFERADFNKQWQNFRSLGVRLAGFLIRIYSRDESMCICSVECSQGHGRHIRRIRDPLRHNCADSIQMVREAKPSWTLLESRVRYASTIYPWELYKETDIIAAECNCSVIQNTDSYKPRLYKLIVLSI
jgi:hypothetical protein